MGEKFRFRHTPKHIRPYVPEGKEESAEKFYRENPGADCLELLERQPSWMAVLAGSRGGHARTRGGLDDMAPNPHVGMLSFGSTTTPSSAIWNITV